MKRKIIISIIIIAIAAGCTRQQKIDEASIAQNTLISFFDNLSEGKFDDALWYFTTDKATREGLNIYNPKGETDHDDMIENYCQATLTCLPANSIESIKISNDEYQYKVQFYKEDGSIFVLWPCCGATEEEMPPQDTFEYTVKKIDGIFKVMTPSLYVP